MKIIKCFFLFFLFVLFSVQIVGANYASEDCHDTLNTATYYSYAYSTPDEAHCNEFGFCSFGHLHLCHNPLMIKSINIKIAPHIEEKALLNSNIKEFISLISLDKPWQPPRKEA